MPLQRKIKGNRQIKKSCKFIGSLAITLLQGEERQRYVNEKLLEMKDIGKGIPVVILVTDEGVKIFNDDQTVVKMAHGITRIAFSTCQPNYKLFAYVSKTQTADGIVITQAHLFKTKKGHHTQELSSCISRAFEIAYNRNTTKRTNRVNLFEQEAEHKKEKVNVQKKHWAKNVMAHGHEHSGHALRAKGIGSVQTSSDVKHNAQIGISSSSTTSDKGTELSLKNASKEMDVKILGHSNNKNNNSNEDLLQQTSDEDLSKQTSKEVDNSQNSVDSSKPKLPAKGVKRRISKGRKISKDKKPLTKTTVSSIDDNVERDSASSGSLSPEVSEFIENVDDCSPNAMDDEILYFSEENPEGEDQDQTLTRSEDEERKISKGSTSLEDWDVIRLSVSDINNTPSNRQKFVVPAAKFGTLTENEDSTFEDVFVNESQGRNEEPFTAEINMNRLTMTEAQILKDAEWYQPGFSRDIAEKILHNRSIGSFFIRDSMSSPGCFVMTLKVSVLVKQTEILNYLIEETSGLLRIKGFSQKFPSLTYLVAHYSSADEDIPCRLLLANNNPLFMRKKQCEVFDQQDGGVNCAAESFEEFYDSDECSDADYENFSSNCEIMQELNGL